MGNVRLNNLTQQDNTFYRRTYSSLMMAVIISMIVVIVMVAVLFYQILHRPLPQFTAQAPDNNKMTLTAFDEPNFLPATLLKWAKKAVVAAYTFDFVNYNQQILLAAPYFTEAGWKSYKDAVAGILQDIAQKKLFVNGVVSGAPVISNEGYLSSGYTWRIQLPFLVTYQAGEGNSQQNYTVIITVIKIPTNIEPMGIGIDQIVMK